MRTLTRLALAGAATLAVGAGITIPFVGAAYAAGGTVNTSIVGSTVAANATITVSGSGFSPNTADPTGLEIIECADPNGDPANLPTNADQQCDGSTINGNQINPDGSGNFSTSYQISALSNANGTSSIACDASNFCVLWVGVDYENDFSGSLNPTGFSAPFEVTGAGANSFSSPNTGSMPVFKASALSITAPTNSFGRTKISESGALPGGVVFTAGTNGTATLSGQPASGGVFPITLSANDGYAPNVTQSFTLYAGLQITTASLASASPTGSYSQAVTAVGGTTPYKWKAVGLPKGLKMNKSTGVIAGTPKPKDKPGTFHVTISVQDHKLKVHKGQTGGHGKELASKNFTLVLS